MPLNSGMEEDEAYPTTTPAKWKINIDIEKFSTTKKTGLLLYSIDSSGGVGHKAYKHKTWNSNCSDGYVLILLGLIEQRSNIASEQSGYWAYTRSYLCYKMLAELNDSYKLFSSLWNPLPTDAYFQNVCLRLMRHGLCKR